MYIHIYIYICIYICIYIYVYICIYTYELSFENLYQVAQHLCFHVLTQGLGVSVSIFQMLCIYNSVASWLFRIFSSSSGACTFTSRSRARAFQQHYFEYSGRRHSQFASARAPPPQGRQCACRRAGYRRHIDQNFGTTHIYAYMYIYTYVYTI